MNHDHLLNLRRHPTWRLLTADHAPLILGFFDLAFIEPNKRAYPQSELCSKLEDYLFSLRRVYGEKEYPRSAQDYLDEWAGPESAYLRKYYPEKGDEPDYDLTPASEKAIEWIRSLEQKTFVGTESRLLTIVQLLKEVVQATETDPQIRIAELEKQKVGLEVEIRKLEMGLAALAHDPTLIKERYYQIEDMARRLLSDFRQVEENFRQLDRRTRERIATSQKNKGELLDDIFGEEDAISASDQGRSFRAFWAFLMSPARQEEMQELVRKVISLEEVKSLRPDEILPHLKYRLMEAGEKVKQTGSALIEHLRKFLNDHVWLENKRIMEIIHSIEKQAVEIKSQLPREPAFMWMDEVRPALELPLDRTLLIPSRNVTLQVIEVKEGQSDFESQSLYAAHYIDEEKLRQRIQAALKDQSQVTLQTLCRLFPLEKGLSELLAYFNIASKEPRTMIEADVHDEIAWEDSPSVAKKVLAPRIIFVR